MCLNPQYINKLKLTVACGKCLECKIHRSTEWAYRIVQECREYGEENCFLTLTYNDQYLPDNSELCLRDVQLFLKRLRKKISPKKVRFFMCGEYGEKKGRPHYHIILFGYKPDDLCFFDYDNKGNKLYRSPTIEKLWDKGFSSIGFVTFDTAKYCAIYIQKESDYKDKQKKPFVNMSRRPGIGYNAISPKALVTDKIYIDGHYIRTPKYWLDTLTKQGCDGLVDIVKQKRINRAREEQLKEIDVIKAELDKRIAKFEKTFKKTLTKKKNV